MQNKHDGAIRSHDCYLERCVKTVWHNTVFIWMNLGASAPVIFIGLLRLKQRSTGKKTPWERLPKGDIDFGEVLFNDVMFWEREKGDLSNEIYRVSLGIFYLIGLVLTTHSSYSFYQIYLLKSVRANRSYLGIWQIREYWQNRLNDFEILKFKRSGNIVSVMWQKAKTFDQGK